MGATFCQPHVDVECFKIRMERGLSFLELNYMLLQSYDFLTLFRRHGWSCRLAVTTNGPIGWTSFGAWNRRRLMASPFLLETADGKRWARPEPVPYGSIPPSPRPTSFSNWRNTHDKDVNRFLSSTLLPVEEIDVLTARRSGNQRCQGAWPMR